MPEIGVTAGQSVEFAAFLLRRAARSPLPGHDGQIDARTLGGEVLVAFTGQRGARALDDKGGDILKPFTFAWQGDTLVFVDAVNGVVGVYTEK